jgi:ribonuclease HI
LGRAAIGALLRTPRLVTVAQISKAICPATHNVAEYRALIEGLKLARDYGIQRIRVYMDSELVVDQVNGVSAVRQAHLGELHEVASSLVALFESIRISWVPREMNAEADRLAIDIAELFQITTDRLMGAEFEDLLQHELADPERFKRVEARIRRASTPLKAV